MMQIISLQERSLKQNQVHQEDARMTIQDTADSRKLLDSSILSKPVTSLISIKDVKIAPSAPSATLRESVTNGE